MHLLCTEETGVDDLSSSKASKMFPNAKNTEQLQKDKRKLEAEKEKMQQEINRHQQKLKELEQHLYPPGRFIFFSHYAHNQIRNLGIVFDKTILYFPATSICDHTLNTRVL